jgi:heme O synthase-like polyprenyltransferase
VRAFDTYPGPASQLAKLTHILFYWTPPHFWVLSLLIQKDYEKAHIPMLPVVMGEAETRQQILLYSLLLPVNLCTTICNCTVYYF